MCAQLIPIMEQELLKQRFEVNNEELAEVRVYKEKSGMIKDKRIVDQIYDYDEVLHGRGLDNIINELVRKI